MDPETGLLLIDKPEGITSHDAVRVARRRIGLRRIGHTGTLDPFATGLLLMCLGRFTRTAEYFHVLPKTYEAEMRLGIETDTHDVTGAVRHEAGVEGVDPPGVARAIRALRGEALQRPPAFSAKRVGGRRAHEGARAGRPQELEPARIVVHSVRVEAVAIPLARFTVTVSTGTYIRALARDVGRTLGCGAHLTSLRRTRIGPFRVEDAGQLDDAGGSRPAGWLSPREALTWMPRRDLDEEESAAIRSGRAIPAGEVPTTGADAEPVAAFLGDVLVAITVRVGDELRPRKVLA